MWRVVVEVKCGKIAGVNNAEDIHDIQINSYILFVSLVIGHSCDGLSAKCGYMAGVECVMNYDDPDNYGIFKCSCMPGWTEQEHLCILDTLAFCNHGQVFDADKGCVYGKTITQS